MTALDPHRGRPTAGRHPGRAGRAGTVLIVDDERAVLATLASLLEAAGFSVATAKDIATAREILSRSRFDLVITDLCFEGRSDRSGWELLAWLAAREPDTPAALLTAYDDPAIRGESLRRGAAAFWAKSIAPADLVVKVRELIAGRPTPEG